MVAALGFYNDYCTIGSNNDKENVTISSTYICTCNHSTYRRSWVKYLKVY